jgi:hypothetical protein
MITGGRYEKSIKSDLETGCRRSEDVSSPLLSQPGFQICMNLICNYLKYLKIMQYFFISASILIIMF